MRSLFESAAAWLRGVPAKGRMLGLGAVIAIEGLSQPGNMLQNPDFQSDWLGLMHENHTLVWCYLPDYFNRRDYNPDAWWCRGNWRWDNEDALPGERRMVLQGAGTVVSQLVNWAVIFDDTVLPPNGQIADDGGFPIAQTALSDRPLRMVRDATLRAWIRGNSVPGGAGNMELRLFSTSSTVVASCPWPTGTYDWRWVEVTLPAATWLAGTPAVNGGTAWILPVFASVRLTYNNAAGSIDLGRVELAEPGPASPNLLSNGGFESVDATNYPTGWSAPQKFLHFPLKLFYLFQTWHNAISDNRGPVLADSTVAHSGARSLKMIMPAGDEKMVVSDPITLNQSTARLIEVNAWIRTDRLAMLHIGAVDQNGTALPGYNVIQKANVTGVPAYTSPFQFSIIANNEWFLMRQVFRPSAPVTTLRLQLCARGVNGCTLEDTGEQPQNNVAGTIWWDDVRLYEPESTADELAARGATWGTNSHSLPGLQLTGLDLGERLLGSNIVNATLYNPGPSQAFRLRWRFTSPAGTNYAFESDSQTVPAGGRAPFQVPYAISETVANAYTEYRGALEILNYAGVPVESNVLWFTTWSTPIDIQLGALYAPPEYTNQYVRLNLGLSTPGFTNMSAIRLEIRRRATGLVTSAVEFAVSPAILAAQRGQIPVDVYDDCRGLLLKSVDISTLPIQPFDNPERQWFLRANALDTNGQVMAYADSDPFCRQAHEAPQPAMTNVVITTNNLLFIDGQPWMPWGRIYGNVPTYNGPLPSTNGVRDLHNLPTWNLYSWRFGKESNTREKDDFNVKRYYCNVQTSRATLTNEWQAHNLQCATAFAFGYPVYDTNSMFGRMGGRTACDDYLAWASNAPMVAALGPGIEECFSEFVVRSTNEINGLREVVDYLRSHTGKPIMASHGGYWNRFEFERIPFFDIYDPETEPLFPANLHTDLRSLIAGTNKTIWLRPQMYENVPYERWRFHTFVELMRGCRGWEMAHGSGDLSLFRGLHGELDYMKAAAFSSDPGPAVTIAPAMEHLVRRANGKTYIIAATTRGLTLGRYRWDDDRPSPVGRSRVTTGRSEARNDDNSYCMGLEPLFTGPTVHGINNVPDCRVWPAGSKLVQWFYLDPAAPPTNMVAIVKADGRWNRGAYWGTIDPDFASTPTREEWFVRMMYKNSAGFAFAGGWGALLYETNKLVTLTNGAARGAMPAAGAWYKLELPLADIGVTTQLVDGVAFIHDEGGRAWWSHTYITNDSGECSYFFRDSVELPADELAATRISVAGLTNGAQVRVVFEDRTINAANGHFFDDFRGRDVYQRFGGDFGLGYGAAPVDLHIYEIDGL